MDDAEVIISKREAELIGKYGLRGAAERIADITGASVVSIVRTLEMETGLGDDDDDRKGTKTRAVGARMMSARRSIR